MKKKQRSAKERRMSQESDAEDVVVEKSDFFDDELDDLDESVAKVVKKTSPEDTISGSCLNDLRLPDKRR